MRLWQKWLLIVEVIVCFGALILFWLLGVLVLIDPTDFIRRTPMLIASVAAGAIGLTVLIYFLVALLREHERLRCRWLVVAAIVIGAAPLVVLVPTVPNGDLWLGFFIIIAPLLCTAHLVWLGRHLLFPSATRRRADA